MSRAESQLKKLTGRFVGFIPGVRGIAVLSGDAQARFFDFLEPLSAERQKELGDWLAGLFLRWDEDKHGSDEIFVQYGGGMVILRRSERLSAAVLADADIRLTAVRVSLSGLFRQITPDLLYAEALPS